MALNKYQLTFRDEDFVAAHCGRAAYDSAHVARISDVVTDQGDGEPALSLIHRVLLPRHPEYGWWENKHKHGSGQGVSKVRQQTWTKVVL